jgi:hypothetical protein
LKKLTLAFIALGLASTPSHLFASTIFNFSFTGNSSVSGDPLTPFSGMGQFTANEVGTTSQYTVTAVTGTTDGQNITGIIRKGGFGFNDNLLFFTPGAPTATLDNSGIAYVLANGVDVSLFLSATPGAGDAQQIFGFPGSLVSEEQTAAVTITPPAAATPEPSTLVFFGTGLLGLAGVARRKLTA